MSQMTQATPVTQEPQVVDVEFDDEGHPYPVYEAPAASEAEVGNVRYDRTGQVIDEDFLKVRFLSEAEIDAVNEAIAASEAEIDAELTLEELTLKYGQLTFCEEHNDWTDADGAVRKMMKPVARDELAIDYAMSLEDLEVKYGELTMQKYIHWVDVHGELRRQYQCVCDEREKCETLSTKPDTKQAETLSQLSTKPDTKQAETLSPLSTKPERKVLVLNIHSEMRFRIPRHIDLKNKNQVVYWGICKDDVLRITLADGKKMEINRDPDESVWYGCDDSDEGEILTDNDQDSSDEEEEEEEEEEEDE